MAIAVGMATPPVAVNIYPACNIAKITMQQITSEILGFVLMGVLSLIIVLFFPQIIMWLPALLR
jgi:C4-dicarboxylate transporter DctM subunit